MNDNLRVASLASDKPSVRITTGQKVTITKIVSGNNIDFMLYPSLTLIVKSLDGNQTYLQRPLVTYSSPYYRNMRVVECDEKFNIGTGIIVEISNQGKNIDFNISVVYEID